MTHPLFNCPNLEPLSWDTPTTIITPLGTLGFEAIIDGVDVCSLAPSAASVTPEGGYLFRWLIAPLQAELLLTPLSPKLPEGMHVDGCWMGIWRVRAAVDIEGVEFRCEWAGDYTWTDGGPNSGQYLDAQTWDDGQVQVTVGTEDALALANRAAHGDFLPKRWAERLGYTALSNDDISKIDPVAYARQGFRLLLLDLPGGETCQVHFVTAWCPAPPTLEDEQTVPLYCSSWFAVDQTSVTVLAGIGCQ